MLKTAHSPIYYYPTTSLEKLAWWVINGVRKPAIKNGFFPAEFYLVTTRFKFLEKLTLGWLKKYHLDSCFKKILLNTEDLDPFVFKAGAINNYQFDAFVDDDLEMINYLKRNTIAKLYWVVPEYRSRSDNHDNKIESCADLTEALRKISEDFSPGRIKKFSNSSSTD